MTTEEQGPFKNGYGASRQYAEQPLRISGGLWHRLHWLFKDWAARFCMWQG